MDSIDNYCTMPVLNYGAIAQLVERNTGSVEVSGSIPLGSTNKLIKPVLVPIV